MRRNHLTFFSACLLVLLSAPMFSQFTGPALEVTNPVNLPLTTTTDPTLLYPKDRAIHIGVGDTLTVHLFGIESFAQPQRVSDDGALQVPLIGLVPVVGLTLREAALSIEDHLRSAGMYRNPQVTLQMTDSPNQVVTITGEMHGVIPVFGERSLLNVLAAAGPFLPTASHTITIHRPGVSQPIIVELGTDVAHSSKGNIPVFPGDTVVVPRVGVVYLLGAFKLQQAIPLNQNSPLTLMQAASLGGGTAFEGKYNDLRIIRTVGYERKVVRVNIRRVTRGKDPDPILQADDILFLPTSPMKAALTNGGFNAASSVASLLVIALQNR